MSLVIFTLAPSWAPYSHLSSLLNLLGLLVAKLKSVLKTGKAPPLKNGVHPFATSYLAWMAPPSKPMSFAQTIVVGSQNGLLNRPRLIARFLFGCPPVSYFKKARSIHTWYLLKLPPCPLFATPSDWFSVTGWLSWPLPRRMPALKPSSMVVSAR